MPSISSIYDHLLHYRAGKFGKTQQQFERKMNSYIDDIRLIAEGFMTPVAKFTKKRSGLISTEMISQTADTIIQTYEDYNSEEEKEFYRAFMYCALALLSSEFSYMGNEAPGFDHCFNFPAEKKDGLTFRYLLENLDMVTSDDGETSFDEFCDFAMYLPLMYELLSGKTISLKTKETDIASTISNREKREIAEDLFEKKEVTEDDFGPDIDVDDLETLVEDPEEVYRECNRIEAGKLKVIYPGYMDYVTSLEKFNELSAKHLNAGFRKNVRYMISAFLVEGGYSIYNNEDAYVELMVSLAKARKTCLREMLHTEKD